MSKNVAHQTPSQVSGRLAKLHRLLEEAGLSYEDLQTPIDDPEMRARLVRFWKSGDYEATIDQTLARAIMGSNFFGVEEASQYFGIKPTVKQLAKLVEIPFRRATLQECKDTHILVAVFPLSILNIRKMCSSLFYSSTDGWYASQRFAKNRGKLGWHLIRKTHVQDSKNKTWDEQQNLLNDGEETPPPQVLVYTIIGHYKNTDERLFENVYVRTNCGDSGDRRVDVGYFVSSGLHVGSGWDGGRRPFIGVSVARKF